MWGSMGPSPESREDKVRHALGQIKVLHQGGFHVAVPHDRVDGAVDAPVLIHGDTVRGEVMGLDVTQAGPKQLPVLIRGLLGGTPCGDGFQ